MLWITLKKHSIIIFMADILFWSECKKTLERDLTLEEYSTWIAPLKLSENSGIKPTSYSVLAPNKFILDWVEENYGNTIVERLSAITNQGEINVNFEISSLKGGGEEQGTGVSADRENGEIRVPKNNTLEIGGQIKKANINRRGQQTNLIPAFSFETFVEGKSNHIALAASRQVASGQKNSYNPLFIYGGVGLGKTHLMHAAGNLIKHKDPQKKITYIHSAYI